MNPFVLAVYGKIIFAPFQQVGKSQQVFLTETVLVVAIFRDDMINTISRTKLYVLPYGIIKDHRNVHEMKRLIQKRKLLVF